MLAGAGHPRTDGRPEGFRGGIRGKIGRFGGMGEFVRRHDRGRPRDSPDQSAPGTPAGAFARKIPKGGKRSKTSTPGRSILPARMRNDFGIAHAQARFEMDFNGSRGASLTGHLNPSSGR